jgi:phosphatidylserine decarboxylase
VAQVVGFMARRIVSWRFPGDTLAAGEKLGMIRFGSRTDVLVPSGAATPLVSPGDRVEAGVTPIARYLR